jgi:hypothetical protein
LNPTNRRGKQIQPKIINPTRRVDKQMRRKKQTSQKQQNDIKYYIPFSNNTGY